VSYGARSATPRSSREHGEALRDPGLEVEKLPLLLAQALVLGEQALGFAHGRDGLLDQGEVTLRPAAFASSRSQGVDILPDPPVSVSYMGNKKPAVSSGFSEWSVPGSNRRPPACKVSCGVVSEGQR
jgi:hypothetical protein